MRWALTSDQSRAAHSGGHVWLLQGSCILGLGWEQEPSSRIFSSVAAIFLRQTTLRVRTPSLQLRLHSDQFPITQLGKETSVGS